MSVIYFCVFFPHHPLTLLYQEEEASCKHKELKLVDSDSIPAVTLYTFCVVVWSVRVHDRLVR